MKHWGWMAIALLSVGLAAGAAEVDPKEDLREKTLPGNEPIDFTSLRKRVDALAAGQNTSFKLHQAEVVFEFPSGAPRIAHVDFHYFRPAPRVGGSPAGWEELRVGVAITVKYGSKSSGRMSGGRQTFDDPRPSPAPANIIAPEEALRRLNRSSLTSRNELRVQLYHVGAKYWAGTVGWSPSSGIYTGHNGKDTEEPFFVRTAPRGKWVWWTVTKHAVAGTRYEFIYVDAVTGNTTSQCTEQPAPNTLLVPVPCAPPR